MTQTKTLQIHPQTYDKLLAIKKKIKAHNLTEVVNYLLNSEIENKTLKDKVNSIDERLSKLEGAK